MTWRQTAYLRSASQAGAEKRIYGSPVRMPCQISPVGSEVVREKWAVDAKRPHLLLSPLKWEEKLTIGSVVTLRGDDYRVMAPVRVWAGSTLDCCETVLEKMTYAHVDQ